MRVVKKIIKLNGAVAVLRVSGVLSFRGKNRKQRIPCVSRVDSPALCLCHSHLPLSIVEMISMKSLWHVLVERGSEVHIRIQSYFCFGRSNMGKSGNKLG